MRQKVIVYVLFIFYVLFIVSGCAKNHNEDGAVSVSTTASTSSVEPTETRFVDNEVTEDEKENNLTKPKNRKKKSSEKSENEKNILAGNNTQKNKKEKNKKEESNNSSEDSRNNQIIDTEDKLNIVTDSDNKKDYSGNKNNDSEDKLENYDPEKGIVLPDDVWE